MILASGARGPGFNSQSSPLITELAEQVRLHFLVVRTYRAEWARSFVFSGCENSATGTRTRVARVRAEYPNQLDYSGDGVMLNHRHIQVKCRDSNGVSEECFTHLLYQTESPRLA